MTARRLLLIDAGAFLNAIEDAMSKTNKPRMTPWFPPDVKPVHIGEYNASQSRDSEMRRWWNGHYWSEAYISGYDGQDARKRMAVSQAFPWRGLREQPPA